MDWRHLARFLLPKKRKIRMQARTKKVKGEAVEEMHKLFVSNMTFSLIQN